MQHAVIAGLRGHLPPPITAVSVQLRIIASVSFWSAAVKVTSVYPWHKRYRSWGQLIVCPLLLVSVSVSHSNDYYCPRLFSNQKVCTVIVIQVFSSKSKASKLEEHARLLFDKSDVISIDSDLGHSFSCFSHCLLLFWVFFLSSFFYTACTLCRQANILIPLHPNSLSALPSADNADWQVNRSLLREGRAIQQRRVEGRKRRLLGFLLALMLAKQMNGIVIQGVELKNKGTEEWKISDWRGVRIKAILWIKFGVVAPWL